MILEPTIISLLHYVIFTPAEFIILAAGISFLHLCGSASRVWRLYVYELSFCPLLVNPYLGSALREFLQI